MNNARVPSRTTDLIVYLASHAEKRKKFSTLFAKLCLQHLRLVVDSMTFGRMHDNSGVWYIVVSKPENPQLYRHDVRVCEPDEPLEYTMPTLLSMMSALAESTGRLKLEYE